VPTLSGWPLEEFLRFIASVQNLPFFAETWTTADFARLKRWKNIAAGVKRICRVGSGIGALEDDYWLEKNKRGE
jgi:hypothetical protein